MVLCHNGIYVAITWYLYVHRWWGDCAKKHACLRCKNRKKKEKKKRKVGRSFCLSILWAAANQSPHKGMLNWICPALACDSTAWLHTWPLMSLTNTGLVHVRKRKCVRHQQPPHKLLQWHWFATWLDSTRLQNFDIRLFLGWYWLFVCLWQVYES